MQIKPQSLGLSVMRKQTRCLCYRRPIENTPKSRNKQCCTSQVLLLCVNEVIKELQRTNEVG